MHLEGKTLANLVSFPLHFNVLIMFGWEKFGKLMDNRQIRQVFPRQHFALYGRSQIKLSMAEKSIDFCNRNKTIMLTRNKNLLI